MGVYINAVHKSKGFNARLLMRFDSVGIRIYPVLYFCRYNSLHDLWGQNANLKWSRANLLHARLQSMDAAWGDSGPEYVCNSHERPADGDFVYRVKQSFRTYVDDKSLPGEFVGVLHRKGRKWVVEQMTLEEAVRRDNARLTV